MNKSIRNAAVFSLLLTVILLITTTVIQGFREEQYANHTANARGFYEARQVARGQISAGGQILAASHKGEDGFYYRSYPTMPQSFGPVVGYLSDQYGLAGLEAGYNGVLTGTDSRVRARGWIDQLTSKEKRGANIELTIHPNTQATAFDLLSSQGYQGAAVALRPSTGEILAMASSPSFDPNLVVNKDTAEATWAQINNDPGQPLVNKASQDTLPPGSIFKIITTAAGLEKGYRPDSQVTGAASITLPGTTTQLTNYAGQQCAGSERVTLQTAFALSCNTAFVEMGIDVGADALRDTASAFGVGESYDLGVPMSDGGMGELADDASVGQSSIGQRDVTMSALQAAVMAATVANDGARMEPYLVKKITTQELDTISEFEPHQVTQAVSPEHANTLEQLMFAAESRTAGGSGTGLASKTGTAEHGEPGGPHTWYVAYDPNKDVAVGVVVKYGGGYGTGATGGQVAAPVGRAILAASPAGDTQ